jgi:hypothetical protein
MDEACSMYGGERIHGFGGKTPTERNHLEALARNETVTLDCVVKNEDMKLWAGVI